MNSSEQEITIEGVIISSKTVRTANDSFPVAHIQSVHVLDDFEAWWGLVHYAILLVTFATMARDPSTIKRYLGWGIGILGIVYVFYRGIVRPTTIAVAITVGGRRHVLARFGAEELRPNSVTVAKSKATALAAAIQAIL